MRRRRSQASRPRLDFDSPGLNQSVSRVGGLIVVGSYVPKRTEQLTRLREAHSMRETEIDVEAILDPSRTARTIAKFSRSFNIALAAGEDVLIFTNRKLVAAASA